MRLLLSIDGTDASRTALAYAVDVAGRLDADLLVTYVLEQVPEEATPADGVDDGENDDGENDTADAEDVPPVVRDAIEDARTTGERLLREASNRARAAGLDVETAMLTGDPHEVISSCAEREGVDGIVVGHRTATDGEGVIDSVAQRLIDHASVPVTVVP